MLDLGKPRASASLSIWARSPERIALSMIALNCMIRSWSLSESGGLGVRVSTATRADAADVAAVAIAAPSITRLRKSRRLCNLTALDSASPHLVYLFGPRLTFDDKMLHPRSSRRKLFLLLSPKTEFPGGFGVH